jgi:hypothetical protein
VTSIAMEARAGVVPVTSIAMEARAGVVPVTSIAMEARTRSTRIEVRPTASLARARGVAAKLEQLPSSAHRRRTSLDMTEWTAMEDAGAGEQHEDGADDAMVGHLKTWDKAATLGRWITRAVTAPSVTAVLGAARRRPQARKKAVARR